MMTFSKTDNSLTVVVLENGKNTVLTTTSSNPNWAAILLALKSQNQNEVVNLMSMTKTIERFSENNVVIKDNNVWFKDRQLHGLDVDRMIQFSKEGIPFLPLAKFLERKAKNPSYRSINELYKFLEHKKMPLTPEGKVLGYKGVRGDNYSVNGNIETVMVSGKTDSTGHILNEIGTEIRCDRNCVCDDFKQGCSPGLHIGSLEYASGWGQKVMIVEFDPADVVCVPEDCNCQKLRTCAYKVVGEYVKPLEDTYNDKFETKREMVKIPIENLSDKQLTDFIDKIKKTPGVTVTESPYIKCSNPDCEVCNPVRCDDPECTECNPVVDDGDENETDDFNNGYSQGVTDGKSHKARLYYATDIDDGNNTQEYIDGYDAGYRFGRYGKE
jgi:hypothetical protein